MSLHFHIIVPVSEDRKQYAYKTFESVAEQIYDSYSVTVVDDGCQSREIRALMREWTEKHGWKLVRNEEPLGIVSSANHAIKNTEFAPDDVHVIARGGDWLLDAYVLDALKHNFTSSDVKFIYTQFLYAVSRRVGYSERVRRRVRTKNRFHKGKWIYGPLYSFYHYVWEGANFEPDLEERWEMQLARPLMQSAGSGVKWVPDILYIFNEKSSV